MSNGKKPKKICFLTMGAYPVPATEGGAVENLTQLLLQNYESKDFNISVDVISKYTKEAEEKSKEYKKVNFHFLKWNPLCMSAYTFIKRAVRKFTGITPMIINPYFFKAVKIMRKNKYDAVIVENGFEFVNATKKYTKAKVVYHLHNEYKQMTRLPASKYLSKADLVIAVSDYVKSVLSNEADVPISTVKNSIDLDRFKSGTNTYGDVRKKFGFSDDDIVFIFVGRLVEEKGVDLLIQAIKEVDDKKVKLLIVGGSAFSDSGKTEYTEALYESAKNEKDRIVFAGFVDYQHLPAFYHACDIAVFPSQWQEAAGLVVIEAQSAGLPVIISDTGGMPEYVSDGSAIKISLGNNYVSDLKAAIERVSKDKALRDKMRDAGADYVKYYDKDNYFDRILAEIEKIS